MIAWRQQHWPCELEWIDNNQFLWTAEEFSRWAGSKATRMEFFYRRAQALQRADGWGSTPRGQWNFDQDNRKPPKKGLEGPAPLWFEPDAITKAVIEKLQSLAERYELSGDSEPFRWGVTQHQAQQVLEHFIATRLAGFGPYQDAMVSGQPTLWHSLISPYINLGLLQPLAVIRQLEQAGRAQQVPLASLEGVIRQLLGGVSSPGLYHHFGEDYSHSNALEAVVPCRSFCISWGQWHGLRRHRAGELNERGYAHHIQRLMVLTNLGLMAGWNPAFTSWFQANSWMPITGSCKPMCWDGSLGRCRAAGQQALCR